MSSLVTTGWINIRITALQAGCTLLARAAEDMVDVCEADQHLAGQILCRKTLRTLKLMSKQVSSKKDVREAEKKKLNKLIVEMDEDDITFADLRKEYLQRRWVSAEPNKYGKYEIKITYPSYFYKALFATLKCHAPRHIFFRLRTDTYEEARDLVAVLILRHQVVMHELMTLADFIDDYLPYQACNYIPIPTYDEIGGMHFKHNTFDETSKFYALHTKPRNCRKRVVYNKFATNQFQIRMGSFVNDQNHRRSHRLFENAQNKEKIQNNDNTDNDQHTAAVIPETPPIQQRWEEAGYTPGDFALLRANATPNNDENHRLAPRTLFR